VRRRRECLACGRRFTTHEVVVERQIRLLKRDGSTEPFDRQKLIRAIELPSAKRPISHTDIERVADEIEEALSRMGSDEIRSGVVGELVMERLRALDHVAYVRFASVYRDFQDPDEFAEEVRELGEQERRAAARREQGELPLER